MKRPLAKLIKKAVRAAKVPVSVIAKSAGVSVPTLYSIINGRTPKQKVIEKVSSTLNVQWEVAMCAWQEQLRLDKYGIKRVVQGTAAQEKVPRDELLLVKRYRLLPKHTKRVIMQVIGLAERGAKPTQ